MTALVTIIVFVAIFGGSTAIVVLLMKKAPLIEEYDDRMPNPSRGREKSTPPSPHQRISEPHSVGPVFYVPHRGSPAPSRSHARLPR